jgi:hypothetical protein
MLAKAADLAKARDNTSDGAEGVTADLISDCIRDAMDSIFSNDVARSEDRFDRPGGRHWPKR